MQILKCNVIVIVPYYLPICIYVFVDAYFVYAWVLLHVTHVNVMLDYLFDV